MCTLFLLLCGQAKVAQSRKSRRALTLQFEMFAEDPVHRPNSARKRSVSTKELGHTTSDLRAQFETELEAIDTSDGPHWYEDDDDEVVGLDKDNVYRILDGEHLTWKRRLQDIFDGCPHRRDHNLHLAINTFSIFVISISCVSFCVMTLPQYVDSRSGKGIDQTNPWFWVDTGCIIFFTLEVVLRLWTTSPWTKLVDVFFAIDVITIAGYLIDTITDALTSMSQGGVAFVRLLRLFRVFRVFKLSRHSKSLQLVVIVLKKSASGLTVLTLPLLLVSLIFSSLIYFFEVSTMNWDPVSATWRTDLGGASEFQSIPDAIWFTASTITTIGYGDVIPSSPMGKVCAVTAGFFGILILSFPNIVLGGNLQFAFRTYYRARARQVLGKKFRKVYYIIVFCMEVKRLAEERAAVNLYNQPQDVQIRVDGDEGKGQREEFGEEGVPRGGGTEQSGTFRAGRLSSAGHQSGGKKGAVNFVATKQELEFYRKDDKELITEENVRQWDLNGLMAVKVLQRLLELCSGVGTTQELYMSFAKSGQLYHSTDIAVTCLYLMEADFLNVFVFRRGATNMLLALTQKACAELLVHGEEGVVDCIRSIDVARLVWKRTTQTQPAFSLQLLIPNYVQWAAVEKLVDNKEFTPNTDIKITFWKMSERLGGGQQGGRASPLQRSSLVHTPVSVVKTEDAKKSLRDVLQRQEIRIKELEQLIAQASQDAVNMYGF